MKAIDKIANRLGAISMGRSFCGDLQMGTEAKHESWLAMIGLMLAAAEYGHVDLEVVRRLDDVLADSDVLPGVLALHAMLAKAVAFTMGDLDDDGNWTT